MRLAGVLSIGVIALVPAVTAIAQSPTPAQAALQELRALGTTGRVLHVAAHPDDENTQLIAYLSRGRGYATAYLSVTRGDGGQNLLGPQLDEKLGVARTQELLTARAIDGGRQFFTRAIDFGFSKNPDETLAIWGRQEVLGDVVRVIRRFKPDVIVTRFPIPPGSGGHGHHTASAILAVEAFKLAGDPNAYPEQLAEGLTVWQPRRVVWNSGPWFRRTALDENPTIQVDSSGNDPVTGEAFSSLATRSRRMHKTQALGEVGRRDITQESFVHLAGEPATRDLMDGVDASWSRIEGAGDIPGAIDQLVAAFDVAQPTAAIPRLLDLRQRLSRVQGWRAVEKREQLDRILQHCLGLTVRTEAPGADVVPGESLPVTASVQLNTDFPVRWKAVSGDGANIAVGRALQSGAVASTPLSFAVPADAPVSQPYWLREPSAVGTYVVREPALIGTPENPPELPVTYTFDVGGQELSLVDAVRTAVRETEKETGTLASPIVVVPPVSLGFTSAAALWRPGETRRVDVVVQALRPRSQGEVALHVPAGWRTSKPQPLSLADAGSVATLGFDVTAPATPSDPEAALPTLTVSAAVGGRTWSTTRIQVAYPHIPSQLLQPAARLRAVAVDVGSRGRSVGYIAGAGDEIPDALRQLGYEVVLLESRDFDAERLASLDAVVIGVRAFNTRGDLPVMMTALSTYVENGGTVVAQYNWARNLKTDTLAPLRLKLSDGRVTNEEATVTVLAPEHPALTTPNRIAPADFAGWVQERGVYFASEWDDRFVPLLSMSDPGEAPLKGALLVAPHGKGHYVYTSLSFFRQLPAGVPGAYRLFANLISLGK